MPVQYVYNRIYFIVSMILWSWRSSLDREVSGVVSDPRVELSEAGGMGVDGRHRKRVSSLSHLPWL